MHATVKWDKEKGLVVVCASRQLVMVMDFTVFKQIHVNKYPPPPIIKIQILLSCPKVCFLFK